MVTADDIRAGGAILRGMVAAVVLAAGAGTRFAGPTHKLLTPLRGRPVVAHAVDAAQRSGLPVIVVTGAADVAEHLPDDVTVVHNERWEDGQATSVRAAIEVARAQGHDAVAVGLGDQPFLEAEAWRAVAASDAAIAVATYDGRRGHPVRLGAEVWHLLPVAGDEVGRSVMRSRPDLVREIPCTGDPFDIDTLEDLHRWS